MQRLLRHTPARDKVGLETLPRPPSSLAVCTLDPAEKNKKRREEKSKRRWWGDSVLGFVWRVLETRADGSASGMFVSLVLAASIIVVLFNKRIKS